MKSTKEMCDWFEIEIYKHFKSLSDADLLESTALANLGYELKDEYEDMLYSQPNWKVNFTVDEMDKAKAAYMEKLNMHLKKWHIREEQLEAINIMPFIKDSWLVQYVKVEADNFICFDAAITKNGVVDVTVKVRNRNNLQKAA